ncbi:hypothetical protein NDU88_004072 [Pleurodeles waltl]|uniref:Uncharacterized protein n=1 Tax=Pleurodeles waltl TaxID=8319 RepID=A0AAV7TRJ6_PLEWA|nr:hypothetical protein NDU88_004072 [Pleurodeles waltl]
MPRSRKRTKTQYQKSSGTRKPFKSGRSDDGVRRKRPVALALRPVRGVLAGRAWCRLDALDSDSRDKLFWPSLTPGAYAKDRQQD